MKFENVVKADTSLQLFLFRFHQSAGKQICRDVSLVTWIQLGLFVCAV